MPFFGDIALLNPKGTIALAEMGLMVHAVEFMLIVAVPVVFLLFFFAWRYRASNTKAKYTPEWENAKMDELIWWAIPFEIVLILGALTWTSTHQLDPKKPLEGGAPMVVQVVALDWKWLFIYPEHNIATVNYLAVPVGRPVRFEVTADAPMNSFWIPQLGGQIYAMTGMVTSLNLVATEAGIYSGASANYSGAGFAQMKFIVDAVSQEDFDAWVRKTQSLPETLTPDAYRELREPATSSELYYGGIANNLFENIVMTFTHRANGSENEGKTWPNGPESPHSH